MTRRDDSRPQKKGQKEGQTEGRKDVPTSNDLVNQDDQAGKKGAPEPGTEGPDGHVDDQPQREDEYLSSVLNEFNPQRKDQKDSSANTNTESTSGTDRQKDGS